MIVLGNKLLQPLLNDDSIAALAAANSASAVTILEKDSFKWGLKGDVQIQLLQQVGDDEALDVNYDDAEIKNLFSYDLNNGLTGFAELDLNLGRDTMNTEERYIGINRIRMFSHL